MDEHSCEGHDGMKNPPDADYPTVGLETATMDELVAELKRRSENLIIYFEHETRGGWHFYLSRRGDVLRLYGALRLRVLPELKHAHDAAMRGTGQSDA